MVSESITPIDVRKRGGTHSGRNLAEFANLLGPLAICAECKKNRMMVRKGYSNGEDDSYLVCPSCKPARGHRIRRVEHELLAIFGVLAWERQEHSRSGQIAQLRDAALKFKAILDTLAGHLADAPKIGESIGKLTEQHTAIMEQITKLRLDLMKAKQINDVAIVQKFIRGLRGYTGELVDARGRIAAALPR